MKCTKCSSMLGGVLFALIAAAQTARAVMGWVVTVNGMTVPIWVSVVAAVITGLLAVCLLRSACGCGSGCCGCACCKKDGDKKGCCDKPGVAPAE